MESNSKGITVVTLNIWGLWLVSKKRQERVRFLGEWLSSCSADIVLLQEVWVSRDADFLLRCGARGGLQYGMHFKSGMFGSGLVTMSKWPLTNTQFFRYSASGNPSAFSCGDYYAGKGVGWAKIKTPAGDLDVFNTHLHANYSHRYSQAVVAGNLGNLGSLRIPGDSFAPYRVAQMAELAQIITAYSGPYSMGTILGGDLNSKPGTLEIALLEAQLPALVDCWGALHPHDDGFTCKSPSNSFQPKRQVPERIDFVYSTLQCSSCELVLKRTPADFSYSDHIAVEAVLQWPSSKAGARAPHPATGQGGAASEPRRQLLYAAAQLLAWGVAGNRNSSLSRLVLCVFMLLLAVAVDGALLALLRPEQLGSVGGVAVLLLLNLLLGVGSAVCFVMGVVGDQGQVQVLAQAREQLLVLAGCNG